MGFVAYGQRNRLATVAYKSEGADVVIWDAVSGART